MGTRLFIATVAILSCATVSAQDFTFGTDLVDGVESGRAGGGFASGFMSFAVSGNQLTAVLRNTSPDSENFGGNNAVGSPSARRFDFDLAGISGADLDVVTWELTAFDDLGSSVVLGNHAGGGIDKWRMKELTDGTFRVKSRGGKDPKAPLYNPSATGGFAPGARYFTQAVLVASFNASIGSSDLNPEIRFENIGGNAKGKTLYGVSISASNPEPSSVLVWGGLVALAATARRRRTRRKPPQLP